MEHHIELKISKSCTQTWSLLDSQMISKMFQRHYDHTMDNMIHLLFRMDLSYVEKQSLFPRSEEEGLGTVPSGTLRHIKVPVQDTTVCLLAQYQQIHQLDHPHQSMSHLSKTLTSGTKATTEANISPDWPWQHLGADFMTFDGSEYLVIMNYYSRMPIVWKMNTSQCNISETITVLKVTFCQIWDTRSDAIRQ